MGAVLFQNTSEVLAFTKDGLKITGTTVPEITSPQKQQIALLDMGTTAAGLFSTILGLAKSNEFLSVSARTALAKVNVFGTLGVFVAKATSTDPNVKLETSDWVDVAGALHVPVARYREEPHATAIGRKTGYKCCDRARSAETSPRHFLRLSVSLMSE